MTTGDHAFFDDIMTHDKLGLSGWPSPIDKSEAHPPILKPLPATSSQGHGFLTLLPFLTL